MKRFLKKALVGTLAALMLASSVLAANGEMDNMVFVGYDVAMYDDVAVDGNDYSIAPDWQNPQKVYTEVIDGKYTGKTVYVPVAADWQFEGFESVYPYAGYYRLYLEGNKQDITDYKGNADQNEGYVFPLWQVNRSDYMWEMYAPYSIWERQQTLVNGTTWTWDFGNAAWNVPDSALMVKSEKKAVVTDVAWNAYGFAKYNNAGVALTAAEQEMYKNFKVGSALKTFAELGLTTEALSAKDAKTNAYVLSDAEIAAKIPVVYSKTISAKFNKENNDGLESKNIAVEYLKNPAWTWDNAAARFVCNTCHDHKTVFVAKETSTCNYVLENATEAGNACSFYIDYTVANVEWSPVYFELAAPYKQYQYLIVNGVALNGANGTERVFRYTGGCASPKLEWRFAHYATSNEVCQRCGKLHNYVEQRYVDGVAEVDYYGNAVYRTAECKHEDSYKTPEGVRGTISVLGTYANY